MTAIYSVGGGGSGGGSGSTIVTVSGLHHLDGDEITVTLANATYDPGEQVGSTYAIANAVSAAGGVSELSSLTFINTKTGANGKYDLDLYLWESNPTFTSSDTAAWDLSAANLSKRRAIVQIRENHWDTSSGTNALAGEVPPSELGQEIKCTGTSAYFSLVWRGAALAVGASQTIKFKFAFRYIR